MARRREMVAMGGGEAYYDGTVIIVKGTGESISFTFSIESGKTGTVEWDDGTTETASGTITHTFNDTDEHVVKCSYCDDVMILPKASLIEIEKWYDEIGIHTLGATQYRSATALKRVAGANYLSCGAWTFYGAFTTNYGNDTSVGPFPSTTSLGYAVFFGCTCLKNVNVGGLIASGNSSALNNLGNGLVADSDGFKAIVTVANDCESFKAIANFPFGAPTTTKFVCSDGYVSYSGGSWISHLT